MPLWATLDSWGTRWEFLVPHFFLKSLRNKLPTRGGCGPLERPGPHHLAYGSASSRQGLSARNGLFQSQTCPSRPSAFPSNPPLTSGEVGEHIIIIIGSPSPRLRVGGSTCWSLVSILPSVAPTPHRLAHHPAHHSPGLGPHSWGRGVCVVGARAAACLDSSGESWYSPRPACPCTPASEKFSVALVPFSLTSSDGDTRRCLVAGGRAPPPPGGSSLAGPGSSVLL